MLHCHKTFIYANISLIQWFCITINILANPILPDDPDVNDDRIDEMRGEQQQPVALAASRLIIQYRNVQIDAQGMNDDWQTHI